MSISSLEWIELGLYRIKPARAATGNDKTDENFIENLSLLYGLKIVPSIRLKSVGLDSAFYFIVCDYWWRETTVLRLSVVPYKLDINRLWLTIKVINIQKEQCQFKK